MTAPDVDLEQGLAALLDSVGIGRYLASGAYAATDVGIVSGGYMQDPSQQIVLTVYPVSDDPPPAATSIVGVQVQLRGTEDPHSVQNRSGLIFNQFQGLADRWFGSLYLAVMWRQTGRLDGKDEQDRWLSSENYYARVSYPTTYRTD